MTMPKVAMVTGAAQGIGLAVCRRLAADGCWIVVADRDHDAALAAAAEIEATTSATRAMAAACDVADDRSVTSAVAAGCGAFGGIDILVNNAGRHLSTFAQPPTRLDPAQWRDLLDVNVIGIVNGARACRAVMGERGGGVIVNIGSIAAIVPDTAYGVSKLAVAGLTVALAKEFATLGIRVCGVAPGLVDSPAAMRDLPAALAEAFVRDRQLIRRLGRMDDVAAAVSFLCSPDASFITGETLTVSGGFPLHV